MGLHMKVKKLRAEKLGQQRLDITYESSPVSRVSPVNRGSNSGLYGSRGRLQGLDSGIRRVAATFGKALHLTYSRKSSGPLVVESDSERYVSHMLTLDPEVLSFATQPFTVDLIERRILRTTADVEAARERYKRVKGQKFYTPDFGVQWHSTGQSGYYTTAIEVKLEGYEGSGQDLQRMALGQNVIENFGMEFLHVIWPKSHSYPLRTNLPLLMKAMRRVDLWPDAEMIAAVEGAVARGVTTARELCDALSLSPNVIPSFLVSGLLSANIGQEVIRGAMKIELAYGDLGFLSVMSGVTQ